MRPTIFDYHDLIDFMSDMIRYRKTMEKGFSVLKETKKFRRLSPSLISLILQRKRRVTIDRAEGLSELCTLSGREKGYFIEWIRKRNVRPGSQKEPSAEEKPRFSARRHASSSLLKDWLNIYVKDSIRLCRSKDQKKSLFRLLAGIADEARIEKSLKFLLREGYLRVNLKGVLVEDTPLTTTGDGKTNQYVRKFHKKSLQIAREGIDMYDTNERFANAMILPLNQENYTELVQIIKEFSEKLKDFSEKHQTNNEKLYQVIINLCPTGGKK